MKMKGLRFRVLYGIILINAFFVITSGTIIIISMWNNSENNAHELSKALIEEIQNAVANRTINYFEPAKAANQSLSYLLYNYYEDPINNRNDREKLFGYYGEIQKIHPQFKMVYYADAAGDLVMLNRMADGSFSRRMVHNTGGEIQIRWDHSNSSYFGSYRNTDEPAETGYDPRKRLWYKSAIEERKIIWTPVYLFATDNLPGFTCAVPIFAPNGNVVGVSSIDIAVDELSRFLGTIRPTPNTGIFILDKQDNLVALQAEQESDLERLFAQSVDSQGNTTYNISSVSELQDEELKSLLQKSLDGGEQAGTVEYGNEKYIVSMVPIVIGDGLDLTLSIIIPENDIVGNVRKNLRDVTVFSVFVLIVIIVISAFFSQAIAGPMRRLAEEMLKIKTFELDSDVHINTSFLEILDMRDSFENMRNGLKNFKRYVPADLVAKLINQNISADLGGEEQELTVFFSDIAKFTSISEKMTPEKLVNDLCVYFEILSKTISENHGTIDKYIGDSVMAFWGAPVQMDDHANKACETALVIRNKLNALFRQWENQGKVSFMTRIGIHTGPVVVGNMGYHERLNYTVIGDTVNVSSRLEGINKVYGTDIIVSENTYEQCTNNYEFRLLDRVSLLGRYQGINIYELITFKDDINKSLKKLFRYYEAGLQHYFNGNWSGGIKYFDTVLKYRPNDTPSRLMRERCVLYQKAPPPEEWNGVFVQPFK